MLDIAWISLAFALGFMARWIGLPPLVGYLIGGFILFQFGARTDAVIQEFSDMGVTLLLFGIGLKLKLGSLVRPEVWGVAGLHMLAILILGTLGFLALAGLGLPLLDGMDRESLLLLAFSLSFSSTVFAAKVLEERGEMHSIYGMIAIGILIMQDLAAVIFLALSSGKLPSPWAVFLILLLPGRWLLFRILDRVGHGELAVLFGLMMSLGGAWLFDLVQVKGDLGALLLGILLAPHPKAEALSKALLHFKDLFLVGFFLSIGLHGLPDGTMLLFSLALALLAPAKGWLFYWLLLRFRLRARTAFLSALSLTNYSEFGLIVAAIGAANGWLGSEWLVILAMTLSFSFIFAAPFNARAHELYERLSHRLTPQQHPERLPYEAEIDPGNADVLILGMGRVGTGAYDSLQAQRGRRPVGIDENLDVVQRHQTAGRTVIQGSATDPDFWHRLQLNRERIQLVLLALPRVSENVFAAEQLKKRGFSGTLGAIARFQEEESSLREAGVHRIFNLYAEAGAGLATHVCRPNAP